MRIRDSSSEKLDVMVGTPRLTLSYEHISTSTTPTPTTITIPNATPYDVVPPLVPCQKDKVGRVMI